jgi:hypothetical protein
MHGDRVLGRNCVTSATAMHTPLQQHGGAGCVVAESKGDKARVLQKNSASHPHFPRPAQGHIPTHPHNHFTPTQTHTHFTHTHFTHTPTHTHTHAHTHTRTHTRARIPRAHARTHAPLQATPSARRPLGQRWHRLCRRHRRRRFLLQQGRRGTAAPPPLGQECPQHRQRPRQPARTRVRWPRRGLTRRLG